jgi:glycosyltransferase involved in cell wall biosynthesis
MNRSEIPLVSLGLPVFNGENFLAEALDSVLAQTFSDFELVICDNASTDATEEISRNYATADPRIRYHRNEKNLGAAPNFNLTFSYASGRYFKWVSHDDTMAPDYLEKTVAVLENNPDAVLCHSLVRLIDSDGETLDIHHSSLDGADSSRASERFAALCLVPHQCLELDGLIRSDAMAKTQCVPSYPGGDRALLCEIAMCGKLLKIDEPIFMTREHPQRYRRAASRPETRIAFYDSKRVGTKQIPTWQLYTDYWRMVLKHVPDRLERIRCAGYLLRWWFVNWNSARLLVDMLALLAPGVLAWAEQFKQTVISPEPGPDAGPHNKSS